MALLRLLFHVQIAALTVVGVDAETKTTEMAPWWYWMKQVPPVSIKSMRMKSLS